MAKGCSRFSVGLATIGVCVFVRQLRLYTCNKNSLELKIWLNDHSTKRTSLSCTYTKRDGWIAFALQKHQVFLVGQRPTLQRQNGKRCPQERHRRSQVQRNLFCGAIESKINEPYKIIDIYTVMLLIKCKLYLFIFKSPLHTATCLNLKDAV